MTSNVSPYLTFKGYCREALTFYKDCLGGGDVVLTTVAGSPIESMCPPHMKDQIMHGTLKKDGILINGSDLIGPGGLTNGNNVAILLTCSSEEEIDLFYKNISQEGTIYDPLKLQFWGDMFASVEDKFGVRWNMVYTPKS